jgi:IS5 family transposase
MSQMNKEKSFVDLELENVTNVNPVLEKINKLVKWDRINKKLISKYKKSASADGRAAYPAIVMFKVLLLQRMYNLSDPQMEACLKDRISFFSVCRVIDKAFEARSFKSGVKKSKQGDK